MQAKAYSARFETWLIRRFMRSAFSRFSIDYLREACVNIHGIYKIFQHYFRPKRIRALKLALPVLSDAKTTVLDIGGTADWWADVAPVTSDITIVNLDARLEADCLRAGYKFKVVDGRSLPFADGQFDLVHSNSVVEHVGSFDDQQRFVSELKRCGKAIYLQTPNKWFPVEPHLVAVFIHWLPFAIERRLVRWLSVWGWVQRPTQAQIDEFLLSTRLLDGREIDRMFPGYRRCDEKFFGLTKSFVVVKS